MDKALRDAINARYGKCVARVIYRLRRFPAKGWDCDDSLLRTLWDHWKRELQEQHSDFHDLIEDLVEQQVKWLVEELAYDEGALLTLVTDEFDDLDEEETDGPVFIPHAVVKELMNRVNERAINEPHRRELQRLLDDQLRDRHQRDMEPYL